MHLCVRLRMYMYVFLRVYTSFYYTHFTCYVRLLFNYIIRKFDIFVKYNSLFSLFLFLPIYIYIYIVALHVNFYDLCGVTYPMGDEYATHFCSFQATCVSGAKKGRCDGRYLKPAST